MTGRAEAQVLRLSLLYALLDGVGVIRAEHLLAALAVWEYAEASARYIFGDALGNPIADRVLDQLRTAPEGLTRTEIRDLFGRHGKGSDIDIALRTLWEMSLVRREQVNTNGRPAERWYATSRGATNAT